MKLRHLVALTVLCAGTAQAIDFGNIVKGGQGALKAATLTDADVKQLTDGSCAQMDAKSRVAGPTDKYTTFLFDELLPAVIRPTSTRRG